MKKLLSVLLIAIICLSCAACQTTQPDEPSSVPVSEPISQEPSSEIETSAPQGSGGVPLDIENNVSVKFNWLGSTYWEYAIEHLGYSREEKPIEESYVWDILSLIEFLGYTKEHFIKASDEYSQILGKPDFTQEEIDILFGDDERAKRELVSPFCIFIGEGPIVYDTPYYTAVWYAEHSVDEWIEVGTPKEDMIRLHDRLEDVWIFDSYREAFEEKYKEFLDRVKE